MDYNDLSINEILSLHEIIINNYGGLSGIRDISLLYSSLERPYTSYGGIQLFPTIEDKISATIHSIIKYHVFTDGNKRTGIQLMIVLIVFNDIPVQYKQTELIQLALDIANGIYDVPDISNWIKEHEI